MPAKLTSDVTRRKKGIKFIVEQWVAKQQKVENKENITVFLHHALVTLA